jgi:hypothetical protein
MTIVLLDHEGDFCTTGSRLIFEVLGRGGLRRRTHGALAIFGGRRAKARRLQSRARRGFPRKQTFR